MLLILVTWTKHLENVGDLEQRLAGGFGSISSSGMHAPDKLTGRPGGTISRLNAVK